MDSLEFQIAFLPQRRSGAESSFFEAINAPGDTSLHHVLTMVPIRFSVILCASAPLRELSPGLVEQRAFAVRVQGARPKQDVAGKTSGFAESGGSGKLENS